MRVQIGELTFRCRVAETPAEQALGLQRYASLAPDEGLLFVFPQPKTTTFWMADVVFPIDIIGIDERSRVSKVVTGAQPGAVERWTFPRVAAVLEVPAGSCRLGRVRVGDEVFLVDERSAQVQEGQSPLRLFILKISGGKYDGQEDRIWNVDVPKGLSEEYIRWGAKKVDVFDAANNLVASYSAQAQEGAMPEGFDSFDADDVFDEGSTEAPEGTPKAQEELKVGDAFKVGRFGPVWHVVKAHGAGGYVQRDGHKRKWFGYSHNRDTGEIAIYPVAQGSGDRIGDPVAFGPLRLLEEDGTPKTAGDVVEFPRSKREKSKDLGEETEVHPITGLGFRVGQTYRTNRPLDFGAPGDESISFPMGTRLKLVDLRDLGDTSLLTFSDGKTTFMAYSHDVKPFLRRADMLSTEDANEPIEDHPAATNNAAGGHSFDEPKEEYFEQLWGDELASNALEPPVQSPVTRRGSAGRDIIVTIPKSRLAEVLAEEADVARREKSGERLGYYWQMGRLPATQPRRIYFVWDGAMRAYHDVTGMDPASNRIFMSARINEVEPVPMTGFRGFRYLNAALGTEADVEADGAKIHDDPENPMNIWRVQNQEGRGPHTQPWAKKPDLRHDDDTGRLWSSFNIEEARPRPGHDFSQEDLYETGMMQPGGSRNYLNSNDTQFGFKSPEDAAKWFGPKRLQKLKEEGYDLVQVPAGQAWLSDSGRQLMYKKPKKQGQIVDEAKFVQKVAEVITGKVDISWVPDRLNGGATERAVVTRRELANWLGKTADDQSLKYILAGAATDRGLSLIGDAFILSGLADSARLGFANRQPTLVLYRATEAHES